MPTPTAAQPQPRTSRAPACVMPQCRSFSTTPHGGRLRGRAWAARTAARRGGDPPLWLHRRPGLAAKPVIDMIVLVGDLDAPIAALVADAGYQFPREFNATLTHRRFLCYPSAAHRTHHLHSWTIGRARRRLRSATACAQTGARGRVRALKRVLAERHRDDREAYTEAKSEFIRRHDQPVAPGHAPHDRG